MISSDRDSRWPKVTSWLRTLGPWLSREQSDYVYASIAERKRRKQTQERVRYAVLAAISVLAIVAGFQWFQAEQQRQSAEKNAVRAQRNEARSKDLLREASKVDFVTASQQKDPAAKLAYLTRAVRNDPTNQVASITLEQLITRQSAFPKCNRSPPSGMTRVNNCVPSALTGDGW